MWPLVGYSRPKRSFTVVDFPEPLGPSRPNTSPRRTSKSTLSTARALGRPQKSLKTLVKPRTEMITSPFEPPSALGAAGRGSRVVVLSSVMRLCNDYSGRQVRLELPLGGGRCWWRGPGRLRHNRLRMVVLELLAFTHQAGAVKDNYQGARCMHHRGEHRRHLAESCQAHATNNKRHAKKKILI